ncbi:MAG TPA: CHASE3 domain-containing protein, partial [Blastocatellia bacterium]|nr:CHASE3 domain-containing protein [Blastocatellia bacterium]
MKWSVATKIGTAFAAAVFVLALGGLVTYYTTERLIEAGNSVEHGQQIIDVTQSLDSLLRDRQQAERSYLLTGEAAHLEAYSRSASAVQSGFTDARRLTQDVSELRRKFEALEVAAAKAADYSKLIIDTRKAKGFDAALAIVRSGVEEKLSEESTRIIRAIEGEEKELQRNLDIESTASAQTAV